MTQNFVGGLVFGGSTTFSPYQAALDAGGVLRVGQQTTLFSGKILNADDTQIWQTVGTGSGSFVGNKYNMAVTSGQWLVRQTRRRFPYFDGKSQRIEETFDNFAPDTNVEKRFGYFSSNAVTPFASNYDGFYLESASGTLNLNVVRDGTKTLDALDITQWSGYANLGVYQNPATWDNFTVVEFKFLWLGGAVLVMSVKVPGQGFVEAHRFDHAGTAQDVMMLSPNQPLRYEIRSSTGSGSFRYVCSQVATEGSIDESGESLGLVGTKIDADVVGTIYAMIGLKKRTDFRDVAVRIADFGLSNTSVTSDAGILVAYINPTLSAPLSYANDSSIQVAYGTGQTITAGTGRRIVAFPLGTQGGSAQLSRNFLAWLSSAIDNTHDEYVLAYVPTTTTQDIYPTANIMEY